MLPRAKFTKKELRAAALEIFAEEGMDKLTFRNLGKKL